MWLHRLALGEALLEGVVAGLLGVGGRQMVGVYQLIASLGNERAGSSATSGNGGHKLHMRALQV
jgi:hypothetical protein